MVSHLLWAQLTHTHGLFSHVTTRCYTTSSILVITGNDLSFASLGGKYLRLDLNQLG